MSDNTHDVKVLNGLIEALIDCADGYTDAARDSDLPRYAGWFDRRASQYLAMVETLKGEVRLRGGSPEDNGSILAKATRAFSGFKQAVLGHKDTLLQLIQSSENQVRSRFDQAANDARLSVTTRDLVRRSLEQLPLSEADLSELEADIGHS